MKMRGVVGVGIGQKDGKDCICVYVKEDNPKIRSVLPESLDEVPVEVVVTATSRRSDGAMRCPSSMAYSRQPSWSPGPRHTLTPPQPGLPGHHGPPIPK